MTDAPHAVDFDARPPMPVSEYEQTVKRVNVGYELVFTLSECFLRALKQPQMNVLVVGAGGGMEIERFAPANPGWKLTGVDPSADMLDLAQSKADSLGVREQVTLVRGTVDDLPAEVRFDAATCIFVLHFLPDNGKLGLLRGIRQRLRHDAPLLAVTAALGDDGGLREDLLGAWQQYGEHMGMPAERMATIIAQLTSMPITTDVEYPRLLHEAGYQRVTRFISVLNGVNGWLAR